MSKFYEFDQDGNFNMEHDDNQIVLGHEAQAIVVKLLIQHMCPFCGVCIPEEDRLCNRCLDEIAEDWGERHSWRSPREKRLRQEILDDYSTLLSGSNLYSQGTSRSE